ncbi:F0F1 ATP synthase subunit delta [Buchnera aphidicola]|uniref:ATP synthase subunit delta n=1 Tax=Buchnera aphidicola str. USDA (Myzus persicae) TaxID=1009856 RepID=W0P5M7_BUCMP|nr:F0F1 ATP synthase subunit delta [Buchnera aphidicola]AHG60353.1 Atph [Buchnera aphidicola str. USDA (Myzus persicae)]AHG60931.1 Atph [Buchnera aphidicola str. W106 (Myzus persicae)]AHG61503.1 Atph [Buchnera aphidicola str. G002 (Myzus persicae)]AHG62076.1 Atph [Buchnera aphidicola str. F009 (Myzus persicae)]WAI02959.1 MAG: F0F1 ATP synthase subunit delta [Buchnera aphidicola (Myzus persicae)]
MSVEHTIARPYARAIFEIAVNSNSIEKWKEMLIFINVIASCEKVRKFLSGSLSPKYLASIFIIVGGEIINQEAKNLIRVLAENQRLKILDSILEQFLALEADYKKIVIIELRTAFLLKEKQIVKIRKTLEKYFSSKIKLVYKIDEYILDGIIIKVNNIVFDLSVRSYLKQLSDALNF